MPARQPFTVLCQTLAGREHCAGRADLHIHTTHSDGSYTPAQVVNLAQRSGLIAIAITDHDTISAVGETRRVASQGLEIVSGVEISSEFRNREVHLLGYFFRTDGVMENALARLREHRRQRFWEMVKRLKSCGVSVDEEKLRRDVGTGVLGRRNLADVLVRTGQAGSVREVFQKYLGDKGRATLPKVLMPIEEAISLIRTAGGVASLAHPAYDCTQDYLRDLGALGLQAVEVDYPGINASRNRELRSWASALGLAITGGSDCHGPDQHRRTVGANSITVRELEVLRQLR